MSHNVASKCHGEHVPRYGYAKHKKWNRTQVWYKSETDPHAHATCKRCCGPDPRKRLPKNMCGCHVRHNLGCNGTKA